MNSRGFYHRTLATLAGIARGLALAVGLALLLCRVDAADETSFDLDRRLPWTTSRVIGSPDPPLPYSTEPTLTNIAWQRPLYVVAEPGTESLLVVEQGGESDRPSQVLRLPDDPAADSTETLIQMTSRLIYGLTVHPGYRTNGYLFVFSNGTTGAPERTNRVSRFTVARQPPNHCDPSSEQIVIEWHSSGHDGGDLVFGHDQMLYIASGDGTSDSDGWVTGQDLTDLAGGVLRINADPPDAGRPYSVPLDNPFLSTPGARPEIWAYGLRNPWRMTIDQESGQIWVGNNGQDQWETAHVIRRGENYGWSVYEGSHPFYLNRPRGPSPVVTPTIEHPHSEFRSLTGGVVYYGQATPDLNGVYVYGDYSTGKIWGGRHDGKNLIWHRELADTSLQIVGFGVSHRADLLIVDLAGTLHRLIPARPESSRPRFPMKLSETGLFLNVAAHQPHPALIPYSVNAPGWADGAQAERFIGLPQESTIRYASSGGWEFPEGAVLTQTLTLPMAEDGANPMEMRRVETRLLTLQQGQWAGYSYRWNESQTDAELVPREGADQELRWLDPNASGGLRRQAWRFPSRTECLTCHSRAVNFVLGLSETQMNRDHDYGGARDNQMRALDRLGVFDRPLRKSPDEMPRLVNPYDTSYPLETRARSYLHVNCSVCHVEAGGGNSRMELGFATPLDRMRLAGARPQHDTFGIDNAMLIAPGDPLRSVLLRRVARRGPGQMPPLVSSMVDTQAVRLIHDWIHSIPAERTFVREWSVTDLTPALVALAAARSREAGRAVFRAAGCDQCHRFQGEGGSTGPDLTGVGQRLDPLELLESVLLPSKLIAPEYALAEIVLRSGETLAGRIENQDADTIRLRLDGALQEPMLIRKSNVRAIQSSPVSNMPTGLLNSFDEGQILDLLAFLIHDGPDQRQP